MKKLLIGGALLSVASFTTLAENYTETSTTYNVKRGFAETLSVTPTEQLGKFRAVLKLPRDSGFYYGRKHSDKPKRKLVLAGAIKGVLNPDFTLNHTFVNKDRTGALYTQNDTITQIYAGDPTCANGTGSVPFTVEETLYIVAGTGIYANVEPGSFLLLEGVINNCPSLPEFGQNDFEVVGGSITFSQ